jgi:hypothetical protein
MSYYKNDWIYAAKIDNLPGCLKIGRTTRSPEIRLKEHNSFNSQKRLEYCFPSSYKLNLPLSEWQIAYTKRVSNSRRIERILHVILEPCMEPLIRSHYEIFCISVDELRQCMRIAVTIKDIIEGYGEEFSKKNIMGYFDAMLDAEEDEEPVEKFVGKKSYIYNKL